MPSQALKRESTTSGPTTAHGPGRALTPPGPSVRGSNAARQERIGDGRAGTAQRLAVTAGGRPNAGAAEASDPSDQGNIVVAGPLELYASQAVIASANGKLVSAGPKGSYLRLEPTGDTKVVGGRRLSRVMPTEQDPYDQEQLPGKSEATLPEDCTQLSAKISGYRSGRATRQGVFAEDGQEARTAKGANDVPAYSHQIYLELMPAFIRSPEPTGLTEERCARLRGLR